MNRQKNPKKNRSFRSTIVRTNFPRSRTFPRKHCRKRMGTRNLFPKRFPKQRKKNRSFRPQPCRRKPQTVCTTSREPAKTTKFYAFSFSFSFISIFSKRVIACHFLPNCNISGLFFPHKAIFQAEKKLLTNFFVYTIIKYRERAV